MADPAIRRIEIAARSPTASTTTELRDASDAEGAPIAGRDIPSSTPPTGKLDAIVEDLLGGGLSGLFEQMEWAEAEIDAACVRHPEHADRLYHSFTLLQPNMAMKRMETEFVYRSHCRELLDRVAAGDDTRPGTAAEICWALCEMSQAVHLPSAVAGLYMRMWQVAGFPAFDSFAEAIGHHEALERTAIGDHEVWARRTLAVSDRRLGDIECRGRHHGVEVNCVYMAQRQMDMDV